MIGRKAGTVTSEVLVPTRKLQPITVQSLAIANYTAGIIVTGSKMVTAMVSTVVRVKPCLVKMLRAAPCS